LGVTLGAQAQLSFTFDTSSNPGWSGFNWVANSPDGGGALQAAYTGTSSPGQNLGWYQGAMVDFGAIPSPDGQYDANSDIRNMIMFSGGVNVSFDLIIDGPTSFTPGVSSWYDFVMVGNSLGNWTQLPTQANPPPGWTGDNYAPDPGYSDPNTYTFNMSYTSTDLGWTYNDSPPPWDFYQLDFIGQTTDGSTPFDFYIDNLTITPAPEPTSLALAGLGAVAALLIFRRRK
jgi:hypothetical protein